jgi:hypothetical protein
MGHSPCRVEFLEPHPITIFFAAQDGKRHQMSVFSGGWEQIETLRSTGEKSSTNTAGTNAVSHCSATIERA